jgi:tripartite-type tricarboxylate transporter receptor subunit TctC
MAAVKNNPGKIRAGVSGLRGGMDLTVQYFNKTNGVKIATVPFTGGSGESLKELLGGRIEAVVTTGTSSLGHVQAGRLRALAVFQPERYGAFADAVPAIRSAKEGWVRSAYYVIGPKGLPASVRDKLASAALQVARSEEFLKFCKDTGYMADPRGIDDSAAEIVQEGGIYADLLKFMERK